MTISLKDLLIQCRQRVVMVYGKTNSGKTTTARAIALHLQEEKIRNKDSGTALIVSGASEFRIADSILGAAPFLIAADVWPGTVTKKLQEALKAVENEHGIKAPDLVAGKDVLTNYVRLHFDPELSQHRTGHESVGAMALRYRAAIRLGYVNSMFFSATEFDNNSLRNQLTDILSENTKATAPLTIRADPGFDRVFEIRSDDQDGSLIPSFFSCDINQVISVLSYFGVVRFSAWHENFLRPHSFKSSSGTKKGGISPLTVDRLMGLNSQVEDLSGSAIIELRNDSDNDVLLAVTAVTINMDTGTVRIRDYIEKDGPSAASKTFDLSSTFERDIMALTHELDNDSNLGD